jgi:vacuolar protein sorting-associated protein 45
LLSSTVQSAAKGSLKTDDYPYIGPSPPPGAMKPTEIIIFIVGGVTYEESKIISQFNALGSGVRCVVGGSVVLSAKSFIRDLTRLQDDR